VAEVAHPVFFQPPQHQPHMHAGAVKKTTTLKKANMTMPSTPSDLRLPTGRKAIFLQAALSR
jgi:hypothetical protein